MAHDHDDDEPDWGFRVAQEKGLEVEDDSDLEVDVDSGKGEAPSKSRLQERLEEMAVAGRAQETVTAAEWEARLRERREARALRQAMTPQRDWVRTLLMAGGGLAAGVAVVVMIMGSLDQSSWSEDRDQLESQLSELEAQLAEQNAADVDPEEVAARTSEQLIAVREEMSVLADQQNDWVDVAQECYLEAGPSQGAPSPCAEELPSLRKDRAEYWSEGSMPLSDEEIYQFTTQTHLNAGQIDPREEWNLISAAGVALPSHEQHWTASSAKPLEDGTYEALWVQRDADGQLLAWATAIWTPESEDATEGEFSRLSVQQTVRGGQIQ